MTVATVLVVASAVAVATAAAGNPVAAVVVATGLGFPADIDYRS
ncbi:MAG: hypothetical protein VZR64_08705 [Eubacterium sp.]|nr:hypothetical protein [Eubacterium sp.]